MIKKLALVACMSFAIAACSSDSNTESTGGTTTPTTPTPTTPTPTTPTPTTPTPTPTTPTPTTPTGSITPSGTTQGVWFGNTSFGEGVVIVNGAGGVTGLSSNGAGQYEAVFGNAGAAMERFFHRDSDNPSNATSFTLAGDLPSTTDPAQADTLTYNLAVANDGQQLNNTGTAGNFSMTFATENDIATIDAASIAGTWVGLTSFCPADCNVTLSVSFAADGSFTGYTQFNDFDQLPLTGTASDSGSAQYLNVTLQWNGQQRDGVVYRDRNTSRLVLNTIGVDGDNGNRSFTAYLTQQ